MSNSTKLILLAVAMAAGFVMFKGEQHRGHGSHEVSCVEWRSVDNAPYYASGATECVRSE